MPFILSPNMDLPLPSVGTEQAPDYALDINNCLSLIDQHDHAPGRGVQITPDGLDINVDLPMNEHNLTEARSVRFEDQAAVLALPTDLTCIYAVDGDLYYNDGDGVDIRLTQNGAIAGAAGSISGLVAPASATYNPLGSSFIWQSNVNTPAIMDCGPVIVRELVANGFGVRLEANASIGSNYTITLPLLPVNESFLSLDSSGNLVAGPEVIGGLTQENMGAVGEQVSSSSGTFSTTSSSFVDVTNLSVNITTTGRPVMLMLQPVPGSGTFSNIVVSTPGDANLRWVWDGGQQWQYNLVSNTTAEPAWYTPGGFNIISYSLPAGTHNFKVQARRQGASSIAVNNCIIVAYEL